MKKSVVVTGATSFIGAPLTSKLSRLGYYVYAIIRPNSKNISNIEKNKNIHIIECDMSNIEKIKELIKENCLAFFHIAWNGTRVPERDDCLIQNQNYLDCVKAYKVALALNCSSFISTGSQAEYGKCVNDIYENYPANPVTEYGKAKLKSFLEISEMSKTDNIKVGWIRIFSAYGPNDYKNSLISYCIDKMIKNEDVALTKAIQNWNYVYLSDVINILVLLMENENYKCEAFNVCSSDSRPLKDYIIELKNILHSDSRLLFGAKAYSSAEGMVSFIPKNDKLKQVLGYNSFVSFEDGVKEILKKENII